MRFKGPLGVYMWFAIIIVGFFLIHEIKRDSIFPWEKIAQGARLWFMVGKVSLTYGSCWGTSLGG